MTLQSRLSDLITSVKGAFTKLEDREVIFTLGGQFLADPNEINGWGVLGPYDNSNTQDLGNSQVTSLNRVAGGICFPYDVEITRMYAWHYNSSAALQPWGWVLASQEKVAGSNTQTTTIILNEVTANNGVGPRDYGDTQNQLTDIDFTGLPNKVIPAGHTIILGLDSPTANGTNYYSRILSGYLSFRRVDT